MFNEKNDLERCFTEEVFRFKSDKRNYQDSLLQKAADLKEKPTARHEIAEHLTITRTMLRRAEDAWTDNVESVQALDGSRIKARHRRSRYPPELVIALDEADSACAHAVRGCLHSLRVIARLGDRMHLRSD